MNPEKKSREKKTRIVETMKKREIIRILRNMITGSSIHGMRIISADHVLVESREQMENSISQFMSDILFAKSIRVKLSKDVFGDNINLLLLLHIFI